MLKFISLESVGLRREALVHRAYWVTDLPTELPVINAIEQTELYYITNKEGSKGSGFGGKTTHMGRANRRSVQREIATPAHPDEERS